MDFQPALRVVPNFQLKLPISAETACRSVERLAFPSENECRPTERRRASSADTSRSVERHAFSARFCPCIEKGCRSIESHAFSAEKTHVFSSTIERHALSAKNACLSIQ